jgi:hypothetical protein
MNLRFRKVWALVLCLAAVGCHKSDKQQSDAVRDGIRQYLSSLNTLNLSAMDMNVTNVKIDGNQAQADVEYTPKSGGAPGAGMKVSYSLEKRGEQWVVVKKNAKGGSIEHPAPGANPHAQPGEVHGNMPNFKDILPPASGSSSSGDTLPPGHPAVTSSQPVPKS